MILDNLLVAYVAIYGNIFFNFWSTGRIKFSTTNDDSDFGVIERLFKKDVGDGARNDTNVQRRVGKPQVRGIKPVLRRIIEHVKESRRKMSFKWGKNKKKKVLYIYDIVLLLHV